jgi:hypothetical protein
MKKKTLIIAVLFLSAGVISPLFAQDVCEEEKSALLEKTWVAKERLYDTKVGIDGIIKLEWDKEAIPEGAKFKILSIVCGGKKMSLTLRQDVDRKVPKVKVYFLFRRESRQGPDAKEKLQTIMDFIFTESEE